MNHGLSFRRLAVALAGAALLFHSPVSSAKSSDEAPSAIEQLTALAKAGNPKAQNELATFYFVRSLSGNKEDFSLAVFWFKQAAAQNEPHALFNMGICYERGLGVDKDIDKALEYYKLAADLGLEKAQLNCALTLQETQGLAEAAKYFEMAARQGNTVCQREIGKMYVKGTGVPLNLDKGISYLKKAATNGDIDAQLSLADLYSGSTKGIDQNPQQMLDYLWQAAERDSAEAMSKIAFCYEKGIGLPKDTSMAVRWYEKAAAKNHPQAMVNLGNCYSEGSGVPQDRARAFKYYQQAADLQYPMAYYNLGVCFALGEGIKKDPYKAYRCFLRAAEAGLPQAQFSLGVIYEEGTGIEADPQKAFHWYRKAADQGDPRALVSVAWCYHEGIGTPKDTDKSRSILEEAAKSQNAEAIKLLKELFPGNTN